MFPFHLMKHEVFEINAIENDGILESIRIDDNSQLSLCTLRRRRLATKSANNEGRERGKNEWFVKPV